jgi:hypothetical protein
VLILPENAFNSSAKSGCGPFFALPARFPSAPFDGAQFYIVKYRQSLKEIHEI